MRAPCESTGVPSPTATNGCKKKKKNLFPREWARSGFVNDGGNGEPTVLFTPKTVCMTALAALTSSYEEGKRSHSGALYSASPFTTDSARQCLFGKGLVGSTMALVRRLILELRASPHKLVLVGNGGALDNENGDGCLPCRLCGRSVHRSEALPHLFNVCETLRMERTRCGYGNVCPFSLLGGSATAPGTETGWDTALVHDLSTFLRAWFNKCKDRSLGQHASERAEGHTESVIPSSQSPPGYGVPAHRARTSTRAMSTGKPLARASCG